MRSLGRIQNAGEVRQFRILTAALEVFSKSSFGDATTDEIARRAHVSKRDIYAQFPDKHAILAAVVQMVLQTGDENLQRVVADSRHDHGSIRERLEIIGLALINEILSPLTGFVSRLVSSECVEQPPIGSIYFDNWYSRRSQEVSQVLAAHLSSRIGKPRRARDFNQAAKHYLALITQLPQLTANVGRREMWTQRSVQAHVQSAVECFLKAYPELA